MIDPRFSDEDLYDLLQDGIEDGNTEAQAEIQAELEWRWPAATDREVAARAERVGRQTPCG